MISFKTLLTTASLTLILCSTQVLAADMQTELTSLSASHPRLMAEQENMTAASEAIKESFSGYLPRIDTNVALGHEDTDRSELVPAGDEFDLTSKSASVTVVQNLFEGFRTEGSVEASTSGLTQAPAQTGIA